MWSVRADRQQGAQGVLSSSGAYETLNLVDSHVFPALVDGKTKRVSASDLERLVSSSSPPLICQCLTPFCANGVRAALSASTAFGRNECLYACKRKECIYACKHVSVSALRASWCCENRNGNAQTHTPQKVPLC